MRADLHLHSTASDGTDSPSVLMERARALGLDIVALTDHDNVNGLGEARASVGDGVRLINGIEFSSAVRGEGGFKCHILGYGIDPDSPVLAEAVKEGVGARRLKLTKRLDYLKDNFGIEFNREELDSLYSNKTVCKLHIAKLLIARGLASDATDAIDRYLNIKLPDDRIDAKMAIDAIISAGGVPVYAHPIGGEREPRLDRAELARRVDILRDMGVRGLECYYSRYSLADIDMIAKIAEERGLYISGGSDYHGQNKTVRLGDLCESGDAVDSSLLTILELLI